METITYSYIWNEVIQPTIHMVFDECKNRDKQDKYCFRIRNEARLRNQIKEDYELIRQKLKKQYYQPQMDMQGLIDTHKIAACLCCSILRNKPFKFIVQREMPQEIFLSNYTMAYYSSLGFIYITLIAEYFINGHEQFAKKLIDQKSLKVPQVSIGHNEYNHGRILSLAQNDIYDNTFDILGYADMMYWIEYYNRQIIENDVFPVELDRTLTK